MAVQGRKRKDWNNEVGEIGRGLFTLYFHREIGEIREVFTLHF
jgi:hypothetical protein